MLKKIIPLLLFLLPGLFLHAQSTISPGTWEGVLHVGGDLHLVFHLTSGTDGTWSATMDSPDQQAFGLPCNEVTFSGDSIRISLDIAKAYYAGRILNDSIMEGKWFQGPGNFPLTLKKQLKVLPPQKLERPQTPLPPFPYSSTDVIYTNADSSIQYGGTFTSPKSGGPFPVAILITGSGQEDRDETIFDHKPFAVIADYLTRNGMAVLRVDDRGVGQTTGNVDQATSMDFANDVLAGIEYLLKRKDVDKNKIGLIGHSEGGLIAPIVFTKWPKLAFIISLAGPGIPGADILLRQQTDPVKGLVSDSAYQAYYLLTKNKFRIMVENKDLPNSSILQKIEQYFAHWKDSISPGMQTALNVQDVTPAEYGQQAALELKPWLKYFIVTNPATFWSNVTCPVLALNGEKDIQVNASENVPEIVAALAKAGNHKVTTHIFPGLNHLFQHCTTCTVAEYAQLTQTMAPEVLAEMADWLKKTIQ